MSLELADCLKTPSASKSRGAPDTSMATPGDLRKGISAHDDFKQQVDFHAMSCALLCLGFPSRLRLQSLHGRGGIRKLESSNATVPWRKHNVSAYTNANGQVLLVRRYANRCINNKSWRCGHAAHICVVLMLRIRQFTLFMSMTEYFIRAGTVCFWRARRVTSYRGLLGC